ncbi:MAG: TolC family protein [Bacteroidetes bacterium]|jgi:cobalt-zinc-cadmium efflux system outer membrane protein|nr:TolC family protein [Bacteroidota bacterium]
MRLSFEEAHRIFLERNPDLQVARARADEQSYEAQALGLWPNPSLSVQRNQVNVPGGLGSENTVALVQSLRYPGEYRARRAAASSATAASSARYEETAAALYEELRVQYTAALAAQQRLGVLQSMTDAVRRAVQIGDVRLEEGDIGPFQRSRLRVALATYEDELAAAQRAYRDTRIELVYFLAPSSHAEHHDAEEALLTLTDALRYRPLDLDYAALVEMALAQRGRVRSAEAALRRQEETVRAERYARLPDLALTAGYRGETRPGLTASGVTVGLEVGLPIFHQRQPQVRAARAARQAARHAMDISRRAVELSVHEAYESLTSYQHRISRITGEVLVQSDQLLDDALYIYEEGEIGLVELLDAVEATKTARLLQINLIEQHNLARYAMDRALGVGPRDSSPIE